MSLFVNQIENADVAEIFRRYPEPMREKILFLRQLILETALENGITKLDETLKWEQPSYLAKNGSTIRIAWNESTPKQYFIYFHCKTKLVSTFKRLYAESFKFEGNRAIIFNDADKIPVTELKHCILLSLLYHTIKKKL